MKAPARLEAFLLVALIAYIAVVPVEALASSDQGIIFTLIRSGPDEESPLDYEVFRLAPDGGLTQLTNSTDRSIDAVWSSDGTKIAFSRFSDGAQQVYAMSPDGSATVRLTTTGGRLPTWSPDASRIAFVSGPDVYVMDADGSDAERVIPNATMPDWSPNGDQIAYVRSTDQGPDIFISYADGSTERQLFARPTPGEALEPDWAPDGMSIAFTHVQTAGSNSVKDVGVINSDGTSKRVVVAGEDPSWSSDGRWISYVSREGDLHVVDEDGSDDVRLTSTSDMEDTPDWHGTAVPEIPAPSPPSVTLPEEEEVVCGRADDIVQVEGRSQPGTQVSVFDAALDSELGQATATSQGDWALSVNLPNGRQTIYARAMRNGVVSESSALRTFEVQMKDRLADFGVQPRTISPGRRDKVRDSAALSVRVLERGIVRFLVVRRGAVVAQSRSVSSARASRKTWTWDGETASGSAASSGQYEAIVQWRGSGCVVELNDKITVDNVRPSLESVRVPARFFPKENDELTEFRDRLDITVNGLSERAKLRIQIVEPGRNNPLTTIDEGWVEEGESAAVSWNGRRRDRSLLDEGTYQLKVTVTDAAGNKGMVLSQEFDLSHKRLVAKRKTLVKNGESFYEALESGCGGVYPSLSDWSGGVWLDVPDCFFDDELPDAAATLYSFKLPEARYYHRLILDAYGYSTLGDDLAGFFLRGSELEFVGLVAGSTPAVRIFGSKKAEGLVNDRNRVRVMLFLFSFCDCVEVDYDIGSVGVTVRYGVLD